MIHLNITPDKIKREIKIVFIYKVIIKMLSIFIIATSFLGIILMTSEYVLFSALSKELQGSTLEFKESISSSQNAVQEINTKLVFLQDVQKNFIRWSSLISHTTLNTPEGIYYNKIEIDKSTPSLTLIGYSKNRNELLKLQDFLDKSSYFVNVDFPAKSLLQKEDINFNIKTTLDVGEIK